LVADISVPRASRRRPRHNLGVGPPPDQRAHPEPRGHAGNRALTDRDHRLRSCAPAKGGPVRPRGDRGGHDLRRAGVVEDLLTPIHAMGPAAAGDRRRSQLAGRGISHDRLCALDLRLRRRLPRHHHPYKQCPGRVRRVGAHHRAAVARCLRRTFTARPFSVRAGRVGRSTRPGPR
jgi:hypothetical protein